MALNPSTELEAINAILATIGESPVASVDTSRADVAMAQNALRTAQREVLSKRWRFNTEFGYPVTKSGEIFPAPDELAGFDLSSMPEQAGMDVIIRRVGGQRVFYDRLNATTSFSQSTLRIDPVWLLDFEDCPQAARSYIAILAARRFQAHAMGSEILDKIGAEEEEAALAALQDDQRRAAPVVPSGIPQTETGVVNQMLVAAGMEPIATVDAPVGRAASTAINLVRSTTKEVLSNRWTFNTEYGYTIQPSGLVGSLNVFKAPAGLAGFRLTRNAAQRNIDALQRPSREYTENGQPVMVIADRLGGKDGFALDTLQIDPVWLLKFSECPEAARRYIAVAATRKFLQRPADAEVAGFTADDEKTALVALHEAERQVAPLSDGSAAQTETDAVNQLLTSLGHNPVVSVEAILTPEASQALNLVRQAVREVCSEGWTFNTEHGLEILPSASYGWTNPHSETYELNVFPVPADLLSFEVTPTEWQQGENFLDLAARPSREYFVDGQSVKLFVDRATNRDGLLRSAIHIDPVWLLPFGDLPEEARHFCLVVASRRFAGDRAPYNRRDELLAARAMKKAHGYRDTNNIFDNLSTRRILGGRPLGPAGFFDHRATGR